MHKVQLVKQLQAKNTTNKSTSLQWTFSSWIACVGDVVSLGCSFKDIAVLRTVGSGAEGIVREVYATNEQTGERFSLLQKTFSLHKPDLVLQHAAAAGAHMALEQALPARTVVQTFGAVCTFKSSTSATCSVFMEDAGTSLGGVIGRLREEVLDQEAAADGQSKGFSFRTWMTRLASMAFAADDAAKDVKRAILRGSVDEQLSGSSSLYASLLAGLVKVGAAAEGALASVETSGVTMSSNLLPVLESLAGLGIVAYKLKEAGRPVVSTAYAKDHMLPERLVWDLTTSTLSSYAALHRAGVIATDADPSNVSQQVRGLTSNNCGSECNRPQCLQYQPYCCYPQSRVAVPLSESGSSLLLARPSSMHCY
jgi:hypothetical protein